MSSKSKSKSKIVVTGDPVVLPAPRLPPKKITREDTNKVIGLSLNELRDQAVALTKLVQSLENTLRADVSLSTVEETKIVLNGMDLCRKKVVVIRDTLKGRARTRLQEV